MKKPEKHKEMLALQAWLTPEQVPSQYILNLVDMLDNPTLHAVQTETLKVLIKLGESQQVWPPEALIRLAKMVSNQSPNCRLQEELAQLLVILAESRVQIWPEEARVSLQDFGGPSSNVQKLIKKFLCTIGGKSCSIEIQRRPNVAGKVDASRHLMDDELIESGHENPEILMKLLDSLDHSVRSRAVEHLSEIAKSEKTLPLEAVEGLLKIACDSQTGTLIRVQAMPPEALEGILSIVSNSKLDLNTRGNAWNNLKKIGLQNLCFSDHGKEICYLSFRPCVLAEYRDSVVDENWVFILEEEPKAPPQSGRWQTCSIQ